MERLRLIRGKVAPLCSGCFLYIFILGSVLSVLFSIFARISTSLSDLQL